MQELVTIIIPVYNGEKFLRRAIMSCLSQTYTNLEIIIVDNCSIDNTKKIAESFQNEDERIKYLYTDIKGVSNARNLGLDHATGKYIQFLDADDELRPDKVFFSMRKLTQDSSIDAVSTGVHIIKDGQVVSEKFSKDFFTDSLLAVNLFMISQPLFKVELSSRFSETQYYIEDWEYWINTLYNKKVIHEEKYVGCNIYAHDENASQNVFKMYEGGLQVSLKTKQQFPKRKMKVKIYDFLYLLIYAYNREKSQETDTLIYQYARRKYKIAKILSKTPVLGWILYLPLKKRMKQNVYM